MKVIKNDEFNIEIFLSNDHLLLNTKETIESYLKSIFHKLNDYYDIKIKGFYDVDAYLDNNYGVVLDINKDDIDFEPVFNSIDMKITINDCKFLYKLEDYLLFDLGDVYYYNNEYYLDLNDSVSDKQMMYLMENANLVYKDIDVIKKRGKKIK